MICNRCGATIPNGDSFCPACGSRASNMRGSLSPAAPLSSSGNSYSSAPTYPSYPSSAPSYAPGTTYPTRSSTDVYVAPAAPHVVVNPVVNASIPSQYRPLSPWEYFGYMLLFAVPLIGLIFLIVFSFDDSNINRRNFARSYWCIILIGVIFSVILFAITGAFLGGLASSSRYFY